MTKKLYVLDVSGFIFRAYFALPPMANAKGESTNALYGFIRSVIKLVKDFSPENMVAVFDGPDNKKQRTEIYEKYKQNRVRNYEDLPEQIAKAKQFCDLIGIPTVEIGGVEADDAMGTIALICKKEGFDVYLCTSDKDLAQLVQDGIFLLNPWKENLIIDRHKVEEIYGVPPEKIVDLLAIMGDASDNIPGLSGFGPKTAVELLKNFSSLEEILDNPEKVSGKKKQETLIAEKEIALLSKRLATIYTDVDFSHSKDNFQLKKPNVSELRGFYLEMEFHSLIKEMDTTLSHTQEAEEIRKEERKNYILVNDEASFVQLLQILDQSSEITFDTETTSLNFMTALPVGIGFSIALGQGYYVPLNGDLKADYVLEQLKPIFESPKHSFIGHNVKYDSHVLKNVGIDVAKIHFDTMLASYILHSESRRHSLDELALQHFGKVKISIKSLIGTGKKEITMDQVPIVHVSEYCCEDVDYTFRLKEILEKDLSKKEALKHLIDDLEIPLTQILKKMERKGIYINSSHLSKMSQELVRELTQLEQEIFLYSGESFNINSPKQLSAILFEKMHIKPLKKSATGNSTSAEVLEALALQHPIAAKVLEYRVLEKLRSTYCDALPHNVHPKTQRIHPTFNQLGTTTGRLSCQDPNLQNIPVKTALGRKIRTAFMPQKNNWSFLAADYSQIELRLLAHLSEDESLIRAFNAGEDIHSYTASLVYNTALKDVSSEMRSNAKAINFGIVYGQQAYGLSQVLGIDIRQAVNFIEAYFQRYPGVAHYMSDNIDKARKTGKTVTMFGRERKLPEINSPNSILRAASERLAINTPLQGSAADLIKWAMIAIDQELSKKSMQSFMILQVHDELIFEGPDDEMDILKQIVKKNMEKVALLKVPLVVDVAIGKNWGEC